MEMPGLKTRQQHALKVSRILEPNYPVCRLGNKLNPWDEYLYIVLSLRTHEHGLHRAYKGFKKAFPAWRDASRASVSKIAAAISSAGLADQRAKRIHSAISLIKRKLGETSLRRLRRMPQEEVEHFLLSLAGIGLKSARCIMMYSLGFSVLPVDIHVARISRRVGLTTHANSNALHADLARIVPPQHRYAFHVCCVQHGRTVCRGHKPRCDECCLSRLCRKIGVKDSWSSGIAPKD